MIHATNILLFLDAEKVPFVLRDDVRSWELAEFTEDLAGRIAQKNGKRVILSSKALKKADRRPGANTVKSEAFHMKYVQGIRLQLDGCDGIAVLPGLDSASEAPEWLRDMAKELYIPIGRFNAFFSGEDDAFLFKETSLKRRELVSMHMPLGRFGRGGRVK